MNAIHKMLVLSLVMAICLVGAGASFAGRGFGQGIPGQPGMKGMPPEGMRPEGMGGMGGMRPEGFKPRINILEGTPVTITGTVDEVGILCGGLEVKTETETFKIYGIGPYEYWDELGVSLPAVGDAITVEGYNVTFSDDTVMIFAMKITVNGVEVQIRDAETGFPLWRKAPPPEETETTD